MEFKFKNILLLSVIFIFLINYVYAINYNYQYWRQDDNTSKVWIKGNWTTTPTRVYFDNTSSTYSANEKNVFCFADDFNGASFNTTYWDVTNGAGSAPTVTGGYASPPSGATNREYESTLNTCTQKNFKGIVRFNPSSASTMNLIVGFTRNYIVTPSSGFPQYITQIRTAGVAGKITYYKTDVVTYALYGGAWANSNHTLVINVTNSTLGSIQLDGSKIVHLNRTYINITNKYRPSLYYTGTQYGSKIYYYLIANSNNIEPSVSCTSTYCDVSMSAGSVTNYQVILPITKKNNLKLYHIYYDNYTVSAISNYNSLNINTFSVKFQNSTFNSIVTTHTGSIMSPISTTSKKKYNITFNWTGFNRTYLNYNFSEFGNLRGNLSSTQINFNIRFHDTNKLINFTNITIKDTNNTKYFYTTNGIKIINPENQTLKFNFRDDNNIFLPINYTFKFTARQNQTFNITVNDTENKFRFTNKTNIGILGANITIIYPDSSTVYKITNSTGYINVPSNYNGNFQIGLYTLLFNKLGYNTTTFTIYLNHTNIPLTKTYNISNSELKILLYDLNGNRLYKSINITAQGDIYTFSGTSTANGEYNKTGINADYYELIFSRIGYSSVTYYVNFTNREIVHLNVYILNSTLGSEKIFYVKDSRLLIPIENVLITFTKLINNNYITIGQILTDGVGFGAITLEDNKKFNLLLSANSYTTKSIPLSTVSSISSYNLLLNPTSTLNFTTFNSLVSYNIQPKNKEIPKSNYNFSLTTVSTGSYINWFAVKYGSNLENVTGSPSGGTAILTLNGAVLPEYFTVYYLINLDNYNTLNYSVSYHVKQLSFNTSFIDAETNNPISTNRNKGIMFSLIIVLLLILISNLFPIDRADGTKSFNSLGLIIGIGTFMFIGWVDVLIGVITMFLLILTLVQRD